MRGRPPRGGFRTDDRSLLPNHQSKLATPGSLAIDLHYAKLEIHSRWTYERFLRLAAFLNLTVGELGSLACIPHYQIEKFEERNLLMEGRSRNYAGALVLTLLEAHACSEYTDDVVKDPYPNLNHTADLA